MASIETVHGVTNQTTLREGW